MPALVHVPAEVFATVDSTPWRKAPSGSSSSVSAVGSTSEKSICSATRLPTLGRLLRALPVTDPSLVCKLVPSLDSGIAAARRKDRVGNENAIKKATKHSKEICINFSSDLLRRHSKIHGAVVPDSRKEPACDACHSSKIKCDGGSRCSLCRKRDIECTYQRANLARRVIEANPDVVFDLSGGNFSANPAPSTTSHRSEPRHEAPRSARADSQTSSSSASDASSPPIMRAPTHVSPLEASWNERTKAGTRVIAHAMGTLRDGGDSDVFSNPSASMKEWLDDCFKSYFGQFHQTWPILHAPTCDDPVEFVPLAASIAIIGAWRQINDPGAMQMIFAIHQILMQYLFAQMVSRSPKAY